MIDLLNGEQYILVATGGANLPAEPITLRLPRHGAPAVSSAPT
jgi:hypothetical protein